MLPICMYWWLHIAQTQHVIGLNYFSESEQRATSVGRRSLDNSRLTCSKHFALLPNIERVRSVLEMNVKTALKATRCASLDGCHAQLIRRNKPHTLYLGRAPASTPMSHATIAPTTRIEPIFTRSFTWHRAVALLAIPQQTSGLEDRKNKNILSLE